LFLGSRPPESTTGLNTFSPRETNPLSGPEGIIKFLLHAHFRISLEVVGHGYFLETVKCVKLT